MPMVMMSLFESDLAAAPWRGESLGGGHADARREAALAAAAVLRIRAVERPHAWADRCRVVLESSSARPGPWRTDAVPYLAGVMDAVWSAPGSALPPRQVTVIKGEQCGATEAIINIIGWMIDQRPGNAMYVCANETNARELAKRRLLPALRMIPEVTAHFTGRANDENVLELATDAMTIVFKGAGLNAQQNLESRPCRWVLVDELDRCLPGGDVVDVVRGRTTTYRDGVVLCVGTPEDEGVGVERQYALSDQRRYHVPCPSCGEYHAREFAMVRWEGGSRADPEIVRRIAWMECPLCGARIDAARNLWQQRRGLWVARGERVWSDGRIARERDGHGRLWAEPYDLVRAEPDRIMAEHGVRVVRDDGRDPDPGAEHAGFAVHGLLRTLVPHGNPYGHVAAELVANGGRATRDWSTRRLGEAWRASRDRAEVADLRALAVPVELGGHAMGVAPEWAVALVGAIDVQRQSVYVEVRAFGPRMERTALVHHAHLPAREGGRLVEIDQLLASCAFPRAGAGEALMRPVAWAIDSGDRTDEVYACCLRARAAGIRHVHPVKGQPGTRRPQLVWWARLGKGSPGELLLLHANADALKSEIFGRISQSAAALAAGPTTGPTRGQAPGEVRWRLPADVGPEYIEHLASEHRVYHPGARAYWEWRLREGHSQNHHLDTHVYALAIARGLGLDVIAPAAPRQQGPTPGQRLMAEMAARLRR